MSNFIFFYDVMPKICIIGNSWSGKSTLARYFWQRYTWAILDLDSIARDQTSTQLLRSSPHYRQPVIDEVCQWTHWILEWCYGDIISYALRTNPVLYWLDISIEDCITHNSTRPREPHKFSSMEEQKKHATELNERIKQYHHHTDDLWYHYHARLFAAYQGEKYHLTHRQMEMYPTPSSS